MVVKLGATGTTGSPASTWLQALWLRSSLGVVQDADHPLTHLSTVMPRAGWEHGAHAALH